MTEPRPTDPSPPVMKPESLQPARAIHRRAHEDASVLLNLWNRLMPRLLATRIAWVLLGVIIILCTISVAAVRVSSPHLAKIQEVHILIGLLVLLVTITPAYRHIGQYAYAILAFTLMLLLAVLHAPAVNGSHRWFILPGGINFQPSELAKIAFVMSVAWYLRLHKDVRQLSRLLVPFLLMLVPMGLILIESDLGTALLFPMALYAMLIAAGAKLRHLVAIALIALSVAPGCYPLLKPYQQQRIISMFVQGKPTAGELHGNLYQQRQSEIAEGSGGLTGQGLHGAAQIRNGLLPESSNDFIFAVIATQWGFIGALGIVLLYVIFFGACMEIAGSTADPFGRVLVVGLASMLMMQTLINLAMTTGIIPVVGITLPFLSYGGSAIAAYMLATGLILNVAIRKHRSG